MKRAGNLFDQIVDRDNLRLAVSKAMRGKRKQADVRAFTRHLDAELARLASEIQSGTVAVGRFSQFVIHDPKERIITAPCFRERVLHHAIMNVCEPHLERWLIFDTYACRKAKGRIAALKRAQSHAHRHSHFLKLDIRKYFDSIPHESLLNRLRRRFKDSRLLALLERIIRAYRGTLGRGLPIGSLTSQHFANFYLGWWDRHLTERLSIPGYVRYMDDMALWGNKAPLQAALIQCREFLASELQLELKATPYFNRTQQGMDFLGCRVFPRHMTLNRASRLRYRHKLLHLEARYYLGEIDEAELQRRTTALTAFTRTEGISTWRFRRTLVDSL